MINHVCKMLAILLITVGAIAMAASVEAATLVNRNGVIWASTFEGDVADLTTSSPAWGIHDNNGFAAESSDGDIYSYTSVNVGRDLSSNSYNMTADFAGTGDVRTVEIRARVPQSLALDGAGALTVAVNDRAYDLRFYRSPWIQWLRHRRGPRPGQHHSGRLDSVPNDSRRCRSDKQPQLLSLSEQQSDARFHER